MPTLNELKQQARDYGLKIGGRKAEVEERVNNVYSKVYFDQVAKIIFKNGRNHILTDHDRNLIHEWTDTTLKERAYNKKNKVHTVEIDWTNRLGNIIRREVLEKTPNRNKLRDVMSQLRAVRNIPKLEITIDTPQYKRYKAIVPEGNRFENDIITFLNTMSPQIETILQPCGVKFNITLKVKLQKIGNGNNIIFQTVPFSSRMTPILNIGGIEPAIGDAIEKIEEILERFTNESSGWQFV